VQQPKGRAAKGGLKMIPKVGLLICNSGASNSGTLTGIASMEVVKELGNDLVGICSLPSLANRVPRQTDIIKKIPCLVVVDGCRNSCAQKIAEKLGLSYSAYLNLEQDLNIRKLGPFTTLDYSSDDVSRLKEAIKETITNLTKREEG
jgi:uncharacterized metal-binding protein